MKWAWSRGLTPRFLELMFVGEGAKLGRDSLVPYNEIRARIAHLLAEGDPATDPDGSPVFNLQHADIDTQSPQVKAAALGCMSQLHLAKLPNYRV